MGDPAKIHHFKLSTGQPARVPDNELDDFIETMESGGITYEELPDDAPVDQPRVPELPPEPAPELGPSAPRRGRPTTPELHDVDVDRDDASVEPGFVDDPDEAGVDMDFTHGQEPFTPSRAPGVTVTREATPPPYAPSSVQRDPLYEPDTSAPWMENALDPIMGAASGATLAGGDEVAGLADDLGMYKAMGLDLGPGGARGLYREEDKLARERSPWAYHIAEGVAGAPMAINAGELGLLGSVGVGATQGLLASDADDVGGRLEGGARGAVAGGALHGAAEGIAATGELGQWGGRKLLGASNEARNAVLGSPADYKRLADKHGLDYAFDGPAQAVDELGLTNRFWPQNARDYANRARELKEGVGEGLGANLDEAGEYLGTHVHRTGDLGPNVEPAAPPLPRDADATRRIVDDELVGHQPEFDSSIPQMMRPSSVADELLTQEQLARSGTEQGSALGDRYAKLRGRLGENPNPMLTPRELNELKSNYYKEAYDARAGDQPDSVAETAASNAGRSANKLLIEALGLHPDPSYLQNYREQAGTFGQAALIEEMATPKAAGSQGQSPGGGPWGTLTAPATRWLKGPGSDLAANVTKLGSEGLDAVGSSLTPDRARAAVGGVTPLAEQAAGRLGTGGPPTQPGRGMGFYDGADQAREHRDVDLSGSVLRALEERPQVLGEFGDKLKQLAGSPDPSALGTELQRLVMTNPAFRAHVLPQL